MEVIIHANALPISYSRGFCITAILKQYSVEAGALCDLVPCGFLVQHDCCENQTLVSACNVRPNYKQTQLCHN